MIAYLALVFALLFQTPPLSVGAQAQISTAIATLRAANPKVQWDAKSAVIADVTCDGINDVVLVGYDEESVWVALAPGTKDGKLTEPVVYNFPVDPGDQAGLCAKPVRIQTSPLDCEGPTGPLPGCKPVKGASIFAIYDDTCDHLDFYWDSQRKALRWLRN